MTKIQEDQFLDCRGLNCPLPILKTSKVISDMRKGEIVKMVSTDQGSISDVDAFTRRTGHKLLDSEAGDGEYIFYIRKV
ncbi:MAG: sulfurtransferase TusA family protein [Candidatus Neomarinimicrobiota bacterium]